MTSTLSRSDHARMARAGVAGLSTRDALAVFDAAWDGRHEAQLVPIRLDLAALRSAPDEAHPMFRALVRRHGRRAAVSLGADEPASFARRVAAVPATERFDLALQVVRENVTAVLGYRDPEAVEADRPFNELGFDSLTAVELRNRVQTTTGLRLPATLIFDHPSPAAVAGQLLAAIAEPWQVTPRAVAAVADDDPIVVVSMACRYPGGANTPEKLWQLLSEEGDLVGEFPTDRGWDVDSLYHPDPDHPGTTYSTAGAFLREAGDFDAGFFGISPREALEMDPQQRLLLETAWEAVERAGISPDSLRGSRTGVYAGVMYHDYGSEAAAGSVVTGRVSYHLGLQGPAVTVDTACSSSLVALHLAAQSLRNGECALALAGGVTVMAQPTTFVAFSRQRGLAADGRCKAFADAADGTGWGEGAGILLLERLSDAQRHRHPILAILKGSAINQDGASNGLTAPNGPAQQRVIHQALTNAQLTPDQIDIVEAHGTGTRLGDPIEAQALLATYGHNRNPNQPLWLGSIKSNIGHTQAAAGAAGVIKIILAMQHATMPKTLHIDHPTTHVDWQTGAISLLTQPRPWPPQPTPRRAAVSSFGVSGTNAHVILEEAPTDHRPPSTRPAPTAFVPLVLSAKTGAALRDQAARLHEHVAAAPEARLDDIGYSLATTRAVFPHRAALLQADRSQLIDNLSVLARGESGNGVVRGTARPAGKMAFLFSGQGSQRAGMGRELHGAYPVFAEAFDEICAEFDRHLDLSLRDVMFGHAGTDAGEALDRTEYTQPALFAFAVAMYRLWEFWGVRPDFVAGHSIGEFTAAHVAGVFDLSDAVRLVCARGRLMQHLPAEGAMVAVQADEEEVSPLLNDAVGIAAVNGRGAVVVSGAEAAVASLSAHFTALGRRVRRLKVSHAFHSPLMDPILDEFRQVAARVTYREPDIAVVSGVTGLQATAEQLADPGYWSGHARMAVRFADQIEFLQRQRVTTYLEIGPDAVLTPLARAGLTTEALVVPAQRRDRAETWASAAALAQLQVGGVVTDPAGIYAGARQVPLPTYAFQHERYWLPSAEPSATLHSASRTPAESRLWESLDKGDLDVFAQAVGAAPDTPQSTLAQAFALLSTWRRDNESTPGSHEVDDAAPYIELSPDFADLTPEEQRAQLSNVVRDGAARVLGHASRASVPVDADLMDLGFASLTVLELASALGKTLGIEVAATTIYDFATPADLAMHLAERIAEQARKTA